MQHQFVEQIVPWPRAMHMAQSGGPYCLISAFYTPERAQFLRFGQPYGYLLPIGVVIRAQDREVFAKHLTTAGHLRLDETLQDPAVSLGVASSRSYGPLIDAQLGPLLKSGATNIRQVYQDESTKSLFAMLEHRRFDYTLSYPSEVVYYATPGNELVFYPIDGNNKLLEGRLSCTKDAATDQVFADIGKIVPSKASWAVFLAAYERWLPDYLIKPYRQQLAETLGYQP